MTHVDCIDRKGLRWGLCTRISPVVRRCMTEGGRPQRDFALKGSYVSWGCICLAHEEAQSSM